MDIKNRVAIVTGGARRVGREISLHLANLGAKVVVNYNASSDEAEVLRKRIEAAGADCITFKADISKGRQVDALVQFALEGFGRIDILVNNSAIFYQTDFLNTTEDDWDAFMNVNLKGAFLCTQKVAREFMRQGYGKIVNIVDVAGERPWKNYTPYCVSKAGLIMLTKAAAKELAPNVQVNAVAPGPVMLPEDWSEEDKRKNIERTLLKREGSPMEVARAVEYLIESDFVTGEVLYVDGGQRLL